jgi:hypothetical protein
VVPLAVQVSPVALLVVHSALVLVLDTSVSQAPPVAIQTGLYDEVYRLTQQPVSHLLPGQQLAPAPPQTAQSELLQIVLASLQVLFAQHGLPAAPQTLQVLDVLSQAAFASLQAVNVELVEQHASPRAPQVLQE